MKRIANKIFTLRNIVITMGTILILLLFVVLYFIRAIQHQIYCERKASEITRNQINDQSGILLEPTVEELKQVPTMSPNSRITPYYRELLKCEGQRRFSSFSWLFLKY